MKKVIKFLFGKPNSRVTLSQTAQLENCANCETPLTGPFCYNCGQKKESRHDFSISHFLGETFHAFTHFNSKFFATIKNLFRRPGFLTLEYILGHRKKYMNPIQLFLVSNVIFFLLSTFNTFTTPLNYIMEGPLSGTMNRMVNDRISREAISYKDYEAKFNEREKGEAKTLVVLMIPI